MGGGVGMIVGARLGSLSRCCKVSSISDPMTAVTCASAQCICCVQWLLQFLHSTYCGVS